MALFRAYAVLASLVASLFLTACSTVYDVKKTEQEEIISLAMDQEHLYVMGKRDYQFPRNRMAELEKIIQSPYAKKMSYIEAKGRVDNLHQLSATLEMIISPDRLNPEQQTDLIENYGFKHLKAIPSTEDYWKNPHLLEELNKTPELLRRNYLFTEGQIIEIKNRQSFVDNYQLSTPIALDIDYYQSRKSFDGGNAGAIIAAPVIIVVAIPVFLLWGIMCSNKGC